MFAGHNWTKAVTQAQANADQTGTTRFVFFDTSGNIRIEKTPPTNLTGTCSVIEPKPVMKEPQQ